MNEKAIENAIVRAERRIRMRAKDVEEKLWRLRAGERVTIRVYGPGIDTTKRAIARFKAEYVFDLECAGATPEEIARFEVAAG